MSLEKHKALAAVRARAYGELFGCTPSAVFPPHALFQKPDDRFPIDILVYTLGTGSGDIDVAVTSGMSDQRMADPGHPHEWKRRELIQYLPKCTEGHARRLHDMAWLPLFDGLYLDTHHSVAWAHAAVAGTPWKNAFLLLPLIRSHREFDITGRPMRGWVVVGPEGVEDDEQLTDWIGRATRFVRSLPAQGE